MSKKVLRFTASWCQPCKMLADTEVKRISGVQTEGFLKDWLV